MKTRNLTQSTLRNDPINRRMHGFSFRIFKDEIEVQDVISPLSFDQIMISSILWMRKCIKNTRNQMAHESGVGTFEFLENSRASSSVAKNTYLKKIFWVRPSIKRHLAIDDHDHAVFDRNGAIISHQSDQRSKIRMRPRYAL